MSHLKRLNRRRKVQADKKAKRTKASKKRKATQPKTDKKKQSAAPEIKTDATEETTPKAGE